MTSRHYRRQDSGLQGIISSLINRPTYYQAAVMQFMTGTQAKRPDELQPRELEELATYVFYRLGYRNVNHTGGHSSTDGGVDVWMLNNDGFVEIVQCKQLRNRVDKNEMVYFAKTMRRQHAVKGHYWAPTGFTQPAIDYAKKNNIALYEEPHIRRLVEGIYQSDLEQRNSQAEQTNSQPMVPVILKPNRFLGMTIKQWIIIIIGVIVAITLLALCIFTFVFLNYFH